MSHSLLRLVTLPLSLSLVACLAQESDPGEPISSQESALTEQAVEGMIVAMAPATSGNAATIAAEFSASFGTGGASCATVETDDLTFVTVTFACPGPLATTGSIHLQLASPAKLEATADLTINGVKLDAALELSASATTTGQGSFDGEISIEGTRRTLVADVSATWTRTDTCVTYSAAGSVTAEGPRGNASATLDVDGRTICQP